MLVASQIKLHRKDNNAAQSLVLFCSPLDNLEEGKGILWLPVFPHSDLHFKRKHIYHDIIYTHRSPC